MKTCARQPRLLGTQSGLQPVELGPECCGQLVAELVEPLGDLRQLGLPLLGIDAEQSLQGLPVDVQAGQVETVRRRNVPDRRLGRLGLTVDPLDYPFEYAAVLAESGPQETAIVVATEP